jgi:uncharacterized damage-inducible protein DinB
VTSINLPSRCRIALEDSNLTISHSLLGEFDQEMAGTRKTLERLPEGKFGFKPHEKSPSMGWMAGHIVHLNKWGIMTCKSDFVDLGAPENQRRDPEPTTAQQAVEAFDKNAAEFRAALAQTTDEQMMQPWSLRMGEKVVFTMPRVAVLRSMVFNHLIHHRAQLTVYLRMNGVPVPALYGPSADESNF